MFLGGVGLLLITFKLAYEMFSVPPDQALALQKGKALEVATVVPTLTGLLIKVLLLVVMALVSSLIGNRGVHLYTESRGLPVTETTVVTEKE